MEDQYEYDRRTDAGAGNRNVKKRLRRWGPTVLPLSTARARLTARQYILDAAADATTVGFGGSMTITDLEVQQTLADQGKEILNHSNPGLSRDQKMEVMRAVS